MIVFFGAPIYTASLTFDGFERPVTINGGLIPHIMPQKVREPDNDNQPDDLNDGEFMWSVDVKAFHVVELMADTEEEARIKADRYVERMGGDVDGTSEVEPKV